MSTAWDLIGRTMLHTLWVGGLIGLAAGAGRMALRRASADVRYVHALVSLILLGLSPFAIGWSLWPERERPGKVEAADVVPAATSPAPVLVPARPPMLSAHSIPTKPVSRFDAIISVLPYVWMTGTPLTFAILAFGMIGAERLRRRSRPLTDHPIGECCRVLSKALGLTRSILVGVCDRVAGPVLIGVVRPMILLPTSALSGWTSEEIEFALLHELIHVQRGDNLVQLIQSLIESFLFFHPAAWRLSAWVRLEREHCCDAAAVVARTGDPTAYARTLLSLSLNAAPPRTGLAMARHHLVARIHHLLGTTEESMRHGTLSRLWIGSACLLLLAPALVVLAQAVPAKQPAAANRDKGLRAMEAWARDTTLGGPSAHVHSLIQLSRVLSRSGQPERAKALLKLAADVAVKGTQIRRPGDTEAVIVGEGSWGFNAVATTNPVGNTKVDGKKEAAKTTVKATRPDNISKPQSISTNYEPSSRALLRDVALEQARIGDQPAAVATLELAEKAKEPESYPLEFSLDAHARLVGAYRALGMMDRARAIANEVKRRAVPTQSNPLFMFVPTVVRAHCEAGDAKRGFAYLDRAMAQEPLEFSRQVLQSHTIIRLCENLPIDPEWSDADVVAECLKRYEATEEPHVKTEMRRHLSICLAARGDIDAAVRLIKTTPDAGPEGFIRPENLVVDVLERAAKESRLRGRTDRAVAIRDRAIREATRDARSWPTSGLLVGQLLDTGDVARVRPHIAKVPAGIARGCSPWSPASRWNKAARTRRNAPSPRPSPMRITTARPRTSGLSRSWGSGSLRASRPPGPPHVGSP